MGLPSRIRDGLAARRAERASRPVPPPGPDPASAETSSEPEVAIATTTTSEYDRAVPYGIQIAAAWAWRVIVIAVLLYGLMWLSSNLSEVTIPLGLSILLAAMLYPVALRLRSWGLPSGAATAITVLGGLILIAGALTLITSQIANQATELSDKVADGFATLSMYLQNGPLEINPKYFSVAEWTARLNTLVTDSSGLIATYAAEVGAQLGHFAAGFALTLFALIYFLYDGRSIFVFLLNFFPKHARARVDEAANKGWRALSSYVRATILIALVDAIGVLIAALILGVPVAPALSALVFLGAFIPIVGSLLSGFVAVLVALVALGWVKALIMLASIIFVAELEGHVLQPFLLGRAVKLHPLAVILAIAIGIIAGGIVGALMAVPLLAFTKSFIQHLAGNPDPPLRTIRWPSGSRRR